jgi:hypothetical protein
MNNKASISIIIIIISLLHSFKQIVSFLFRKLFNNSEYRIYVKDFHFLFMIKVAYENLVGKFIHTEI